MIVGGLRTRLIRESLFQTVKEALEDLGWFNSGRKHLPVSIRSQEVGRETEIPLNTIALADGSISDLSGELGSNFSVFSLVFYFDIYAESDAMGLHLAGDIRDIIQGRFPSIGRTGPTIDVLNYSTATPTKFCTVQVESVDIGKTEGYSRVFEEHWYQVACVLEDSYTNENG